MTSPAPRRDYWPLFYACLIALAAALVYLPTLRAEFVHWKDGVEIYANPHLGALTSERLGWMLTDAQYVGRYQPLTWLGWSLTHQVWGTEPSAYHFGNWALHAGNSVLMFLCLVRLFRLLLPVGDQRRLRIYLAAFAGALFWALHPMRVEPVAWAAGRPYLQAMFFLLLSFSFYLRARFPVGATKPFNADYWIALVLLACSMLSYPMAVGYAPALLALEGYLRPKAPKETERTWGDVMKHAIPVWVVTGAIFAVSLKAHWIAAEGLAQFSILERATQAAYVWAQFVWKPFWPVGLSPLYTDLVEVNAAASRFVVSWVVAVGMTVAAIVLRKRYPGFLALWVAHLVILFPHLGLTEKPHFATDRSTYLQGVILAIVVAAPILFTRLFKPAFVLVCASALLLANLSMRQTAVWQNNEAFFDHILESIGNHPMRPGIYTQYGEAKVEKNQISEGIYFFSHAIQLDPKFVDAHAGLARTYYMTADYVKAQEAYGNALKLAPERPDLRNALGDVFFAQRDYTHAEQQYREAIRLDQVNATAFSNLGITYAAQKRPAEAEAAMIQASKLEPKNAQHLLNLSTLMRQLGRTNESTKYKHLAEDIIDPHNDHEGHDHPH